MLDILSSVPRLDGEPNQSLADASNMKSLSGYPLRTPATSALDKRVLATAHLDDPTSEQPVPFPRLQLINTRMRQRTSCGTRSQWRRPVLAGVVEVPRSLRHQSHTRFWVMSKTGEVEELVEQLDPRP
jgi:hypothetical protein